MTYHKLLKYLIANLNAGKTYNPNTQIIQWAIAQGYDVDELCKFIIAEFNVMLEETA